MDLDLNKTIDKIQKNELIKNFMKELSKAVESFNHQNVMKGEKMKNIELTPEEDWEFYRKKCNFLQEFFKDDIYLVTNKYEQDDEFHRYKVAQYIGNHERKYIAFEKDLPKNVQIGDVVRKQGGVYIFDEKSTKYVKDSLEKIKQEILNKRNK